MTQIAVLIAGCLGLSLVARAALLYRGVDGLAFALVVTIGALLCFGIGELLMRARRVARLEAEVRSLPTEASDAMIERASSAVRSALRARIAGAALPAAPALFSSYLLGMLVMIGLLGTFLGLFETLRGAREALTASTDVAALRVGLAAPMQGLSRAFGASAAGVSASAMLGVALVFVRRADARLSGAFSAYASGPLSPITVAGRTLAALEMLAAKGDATALATGAAIEKAITPRLDAAVAHAGQAIDAHVARWETRAEASSTSIRQTILAAHHEELTALRSAVESDATRILAGLSEHREDAARRALALSSELQAHLASLTSSVAGSLDAVVKSSTAAPEAAARIIDVAAKNLAHRVEQDADHDQRLSRLAESLSTLVASVASQTAASDARLARLEETLSTSYASSADLLTSRLSAHAATLEEGVTQNLVLVRDAADALREGGEDLTSVAQLFAGSVDRYREASDRWLAGLSALRTAAEQAAKGDAQDLIGAYLDQTREVFDHSMQFQRQLFVELRQLASARRSGPDA